MGAYRCDHTFTQDAPHHELRCTKCFVTEPRAMRARIKELESGVETWSGGVEIHRDQRYIITRDGVHIGYVQQYNDGGVWTAMARDKVGNIYWCGAHKTREEAVRDVLLFADGCGGAR